MSRSTAFSPRILAASLVLALGALSFNASAYQPETREGELVQQIVLKWGTHVQDALGLDVQAWTDEILPLLMQSDVDSLQKALDAPTFTAMNDALRGGPVPQALSLDIGTLALGDIDKDLVLKPVTPCRLFDTRFPTPNPIAAKGTRDFDITNVVNYSAQGGAVTDCGVGAAASVAAVVVNFTVVSPTGDGFITAYPAGVPKPLAATVNFRAGSVVANNLSVVKLGQGAGQKELTVYADARTDVVGDIVGYFAAPQPTALECMETSWALSTSFNPGWSNALNAPACPTGFTRTATDCESEPNVALYTSSGGRCGATNNSTIPKQISARSVCCRLPGR